MDRILEGIAVLAWAVPWIAGGWMLTASLFRLRRSESGMVGLALGLVLQIWLVNLLSRLLQPPWSFWAASVLVLGAGLASRMRSDGSPLPRIEAVQWLTLGGLTLLFNAIGRGLGVFDDYQNLPTVSLMAAGDIPPHFALDPSLRFGYHYLLLLLAAQIMRIANMLPWTALDLARGLMLGLPLVLAGLWIHRLTRSALAAFLGTCVVAFAGGSRWLLLLLPKALLERISGQVTLIGSAAASAPTLVEAMVSPWKIDGAGPIPFPFAFHSGVNPPYVMLHTGIAGSGILIFVLLLLTAERWRRRGAALATTVLLASLALANEIAFLLLGLGMLIVGLAWLGWRHKVADRRRPGKWLLVGAAGLAVAAVQGGMLTEIVDSRLHPPATITSYFDPTPAWVWPPSIVSAHLGALSVTNPWQLAAALLEMGPIVVATPLLLARGWRCLRRGAWLEAAVLASSAGALGAAVLLFKGPLYTAAPRLMSSWFLVSALYYVPLLRSWAGPRREFWRVGAMLAGLVSCFGGLMLFGVQLAAIQRPVFSTFISAMDAKMSENQWDRLAVGALVFDPVVFRAPTVFGRPTRSSATWYTRLPEWEALRDAANPKQLRRAGFRYMYIDGDYWEQLSPGQQAALGAPCVEEIEQVNGVRGENDYRKDFRRLLDIRACG